MDLKGSPKQLWRTAARTTLALGLFAAACPPASAYFTSPNPGHTGGFGFRIAPIGDWNQNGVPDVAILSFDEYPASAPACTNPNNNLPCTGVVYIYDGATGNLLDTILPPTGVYAGLVSAQALPDANSDGLPELIVTAGEVGQVGWVTRIYMSPDASPGPVITTPVADEWSGFGEIPVCSKDLNDDGKGDIIFSNPSLALYPELAPPNQVPGAGAVYVFSGADGTLLRTQRAPASNDYSGFRAVGTVGDIDADGVEDYLASSNGVRTGNEDPWDLMIYVYSGASGALLATHTHSGFHGGYLWEGGDVDGDGKGEYIIGLVPELTMDIYAAETGDLIKTIARLPDPNYFPEGTVCTKFDFNGDGHTDILGGNPSYGTFPGMDDPMGQYALFDGATGTLANRVLGSAFAEGGLTHHYGLGYGVSAADFDGDGKDELIVAARTEKPMNSNDNRVYILDAATGGEKVIPDPAAVALARSRGDFDRSGCTDLSDFLFILDHWFKEVDGKLVELPDFFGFLDNWQQGTGC